LRTVGSQGGAKLRRLVEKVPLNYSFLKQKPRNCAVFVCM
jgi:hypothetical protein